MNRVKQSILFRLSKFALTFCFFMSETARTSKTDSSVAIIYLTELIQQFPLNPFIFWKGLA